MQAGELCAHVRTPDELPRYRLVEPWVDAVHHERVSAGWAERFGTDVCRDPGEDFCWVEGAPGMPWAMVFVSVPEPKTVRDRVHGTSGATARTWWPPAPGCCARDGERDWDVLADPDGNEFCVFAPPVTPSRDGRRQPARLRARQGAGRPRLDLVS